MFLQLGRPLQLDGKTMDFLLDEMLSLPRPAKTQNHDLPDVSKCKYC